MDYNLPDSETREGTNTNNFVEAAFKHFDEVFLKHTKNHRIDNCCFAVEEFFQHYEHYLHKLTKSIESSKIKKIKEDRRKIWEVGSV